MRKVFLILLCLIINIPFVYSYDDERLDIVLEYNVPKNIDTVFSKTTIVALKIEEILADGQLITCFEDIRDMTVSEIQYEKAVDNLCYINMTWYRYQDYYIWNDGRGIIFLKDENGFYVPQTNSYRIPVNTKTLTIKYKVLLPTENINRDELLNSFPGDGTYSPIYIKEVDINKVKNKRSHFRPNCDL